MESASSHHRFGVLSGIHPGDVNPLGAGIQKTKDDIRIVRDADHRRNIEGLGGADAVLNGQFIEDFVLQIECNVVEAQSA